MEVCTNSYFWWWIFSRSLGVICYNRWVLTGEGHKNHFKDRHLSKWQPTFLFFDLFLTQWIMIILIKRWKTDNFESHNSLNLSFTNIWGLCLKLIWMWVFPWIKLSWNFLLYVRQTWMTQLILAVSLWGVIFL